jgi:hypothetical protein
MGRLRAQQRRPLAAAAFFAGSLLLRPVWPETWKMALRAALPEHLVALCKRVQRTPLGGRP